jgi:flagellar basal body-associated protein FliL
MAENAESLFGGNFIWIIIIILALIFLFGGGLI